MNPKVSVIIPTSRKNIKGLKQLLNQTYENYEIILISDDAIHIKNKKIKVIKHPTKNVSQKRNVGIKKAKGEIIAFIDDDAIPNKNWILNGVKGLKNVDCVCGPNILPKNSSIGQKVSDILLKLLTFRKKFSKVKNFDCSYHEFATCNAFIKKYVWDSLSGFNEKIMYPGEDVEFFFLANKKYKMKYVQNYVFHNRRNFIGHFKQIYNWVKNDTELCFAYPEMLLKKEFILGLLAPFAFVVIILSNILLYFIYGIFLYFLMMSVFSLFHPKEIKEYLMLMIGIPIHILTGLLGFWITILSIHKWKKFRNARRLN